MADADTGAEAGVLEHEGVALAWRRSAGQRAGACGLVWLCGFHSDMEGEKATALHVAARADGRAFLRFDYSGHGASGGDFAEGFIGRWRSDALAVIDRLTEGPQVLVGSSMGAWIALLCALARPDRVAGLLLLAPATDFTERLMWARMDEGVRRQILEQGRWMRPSAYDPAGYPVTRRLIEEGRSWLLMDGPIPVRVPVEILQGGRDPDVPPMHARALLDLLEGEEAAFTLVKDGDHRLSRPADIVRMTRMALALAERVDTRAAA